jgi:hypothetical protein
MPRTTGGAPAGPSCAVISRGHLLSCHPGVAWRNVEVARDKLVHATDRRPFAAPQP